MFSRGTRNDEFGHAQVLRDLEILLLRTSQKTNGGVSEGTDQDSLDVSQENAEDGAQGEPLWTAIRRIAQQVQVLSAGLTPDRVLVVDEGNSIHTTITTIYGLSAIDTFPADAITAVPSASPSSGATDTYDVGLAAAYDVLTDSYVWISSGVEVNGITYQGANLSIAKGHSILAIQSVDVPITGGGGATAKVWLPFSLA